MEPSQASLNRSEAASTSQTIAIFGASGAIGTALVEWFAHYDWRVVAVSRSGQRPASSPKTVLWLASDPRVDGFAAGWKQSMPPLNAVVWAQGANLNDNLETFDRAAHETLYHANVMYILLTMQALLSQDMLVSSARLCIISSIWQSLARQNKLSYCITKAALHGLVLSASLELGQTGHLINAVLPGALETPMTRANLTEEQRRTLAGLTYFNRLPNLADVCQAVGFLCSPENTSITGQFLAVDQGFSHVRII